MDKGATSVEEVHKSIAELPLEMLERLDVFQDTVRDVKELQDTSIGAIYDAIRRVNHEVTGLRPRDAALGTGPQAGQAQDGEEAGQGHGEARRGPSRAA